MTSTGKCYQSVYGSIADAINSQAREDHIYGIGPVVKDLVHHLEEEVFSEVLHKNKLVLAIILSKALIILSSTM